MSIEELTNALVTGVITSIFTSLLLFFSIYIRAHLAVQRVIGKWRFAHQQDSDPDKLVTIRHRGGGTVEIKTGLHDPDRWKGWLEFRIGLNALYGKGTYKYLVQERWGILELISWNEEPDHLYFNGTGYNKEGVVISFSYELVKQ